MTDPRLRVAAFSLGSDALLLLNEIDTADADRGIVRVDTRDPDPAQVERVSKAMHEWYCDCGDSEWHGMFPGRARAVLAALTEAEGEQ